MIRLLTLALLIGLAGCAPTAPTQPQPPEPRDPLLVPPGESDEFLDMELPPNHFTHTRGAGERFAGKDAAHVANLCLNCHTTSQTSFATEDWSTSLHALAGIGCEACHGAHQDGFVPHPGPDRCRACHPQQETEMRRGQHADEPGSGLRCDSCHRAHGFDLDEVKQPSSCTSCHRDSVHVQTYATSKMGTIFDREGFDEDGVPAAATCHMCHMTLSAVHESTDDFRCDTVMDHDVTIERLADSDRMTEDAAEGFVEICLQCHARAISEYRLTHSEPILTTWKSGGR